MSSSEADEYLVSRLEYYRDHYGSLRAIRITEPDLEKLRAYRNVKLPQYLFRVNSDQSQGVNSPETLQSDGRACQIAFNSFRRSTEELRSYLKRHLSHDKRHWSPFISFSSSLLATLRHAMWQKATGQINIQLAAPDVRRLEDGTNILPANLLLEGFGVRKEHPV